MIGGCLAEWFSDAKIRELLCRRRAALALKRGKAKPELLFERLQKQAIGDDAELIAAFPSRRELHCLRPRRGHRLASDKTLQVTLLRAVEQQLQSRKDGRSSWFSNLEKLIAKIRSRALDGEFEFRSFTVVARHKTGNAFRPLVKTDLIEGVISSLVAGYLRLVMNTQWADCSYAFREPGTHSITGHHGAFDALVEFRQRHSNRELWVAETDIQAFFDVIEHRTIRVCLRLAAVRSTAHGTPVCKRALTFVEALLSGYNFREKVLAQATVSLHEQHPDGYFSWPEAELRKLHPDFARAKFGIPQGNALSPILANVVLDIADRYLVHKTNATELLYCRFCDDMLVVSCSQMLAEQAWKDYNGALQRLKLPTHPFLVPDGVRPKSRKPYRWAGEDQWIDFVGYSLNRDGKSRIRAGSETKHRGKMLSKVDRFLNAVESPSRAKTVSPDAIFRKLILHLMASSTGGARSKRCWIAGFRHQKINPALSKQLRELGRFRHSQFNYAARHLREFLQLRKKSNDSRLVRSFGFIGRPISYTGPFLADVHSR